MEAGEWVTVRVANCDFVTCVVTDKIVVLGTNELELELTMTMSSLPHIAPH